MIHDKSPQRPPVAGVPAGDGRNTGDTAAGARAPGHAPAPVPPPAPAPAPAPAPDGQPGRARSPLLVCWSVLNLVVRLVDIALRL